MTTSTTSVRAGDDRVVAWFGQRWARGALLGAVVGAVVLALLVAVVKDGALYPAWLGAGLAGAVAGGLVGGFLAVGLGPPRNPAAWDTYLLDHREETCVGVRVRDTGTATQVLELLHQEGATSVELLG